MFPPAFWFFEGGEERVRPLTTLMLRFGKTAKSSKLVVFALDLHYLCCVTKQNDGHTYP